MMRSSRYLQYTCRLALALGFAGYAGAQVSASAYRVLGQPDLNQNGANIVQAGSLLTPGAVALDQRGDQVHLYIADTGNARVLAWPDVRSYQIGDAPTLLLGQPGPSYFNPLGIGTKGFNRPVALAVDPKTGNLYVADSGNHRVVRFPNPFANPARIEPDAVYGQNDFNSRSAGTSSSGMNTPSGVAFDSAGNLWVADNGNQRILRFAAGSLDNATPPPADTVIGQPDFVSNARNRGGAVSGSGFDSPWGIVFDGQDNLYVADVNNSRVLKFKAPLGPNSQGTAAAAVFGQPDFVTRGVPAQASASSLNGPAGIVVDSAGRLYVSIPGDNRVLIFPSTGGAATTVIGQSDFVTTQANASNHPLASANSLSTPFDVKVDANGNVYVADTTNNRVVSFPPNSRSATQVWGQNDLSANGGNQIKPGSLVQPTKIAVDYSQAPFALYIADTGNHRVLGWRDAVRFRSGDPADFVIGQPDLRTGVANVDTHGSANPTSTSLSSPQGLVVDRSGNLWVADTANDRVLRFPRPASQSGRITPDVVIGQQDFTSSVSAAVSASSLNAPVGLALGPDGNLFVADYLNNRVLEFAAGSGTHASAIRVYGQPNFVSSVSPSTLSAQTLFGPRGVFVDPAYNLYIADTGANRVLVIPNTQVAATSGMPAAFVIGQSTFSSTAGGGTSLRAPVDVALDSNGSIYVADSGDDRILIFPSLLFLPVSGGTATAVVGQRDLSGTAPNWDTTDGRATADSLYAPRAIYLDRRDTLYVGDTANNRVLHFLKSAAVVNVAHYQGGVPVAQGGLAALFGTGLTDGATGSAIPPFPFSLQNRQVVINETILAPVFGVVDKQINFQVPSGAPVGTDRIAVRLADTAELVAGGSVLVATTSPGLFTLSQDGKGQAAVRNQDGITINGPSSPAPKNSVISLYGTGQGQVSPGVPDGTPAPTNVNTIAVPTADGKTCLSTQPSVCVAIGSNFGNILFSGLAPTFVGLWQINVQIPSDTPSGNAIPVRVIINGVPSNTVTVAVQ